MARGERKTKISLARRLGRSERSLLGSIAEPLCTVRKHGIATMITVIINDSVECPGKGTMNFFYDG